MLTPEEIEKEILKYTTKVVNEDNPQICKYAFGRKSKTSVITKDDGHWYLAGKLLDVDAYNQSRPKVKKKHE